MNLWIAILVCLLTLLLMCAPLLSVARGRLFGAVCLCGIALPMTGFAAESGAAADAAVSIAGTSAQGMGFLAAALSTGLSALGAGIAVAAAAPAAIGAVSENSKAFGKAIIFVVLGEGIAIYGLLISILIINRL